MKNGFQARISKIIALLDELLDGIECTPEKTGIRELHDGKSVCVLNSEKMKAVLSELDLLKNYLPLGIKLKSAVNPEISELRILVDTIEYKLLKPSGLVTRGDDDVYYFSERILSDVRTLIYEFVAVFSKLNSNS